jgi:hypothetical protein
MIVMSKAHRELVDAWRKVPLKKRPFLLPGDEFLKKEKTRPLIATHSSFQDYSHGSDYNDRTSTMLHTGLIPLPYLGDLKNAKIYILLNNPGIGDLDYIAEDRFPELRRALTRSLRQELDPEYPMMYLNPAFSWHGGGQYWISRFKEYISLIMSKEVVTFHEAMRTLSQQICCLEYLPYHSARFGLRQAFQESLRSTRLVKTFAQEDLLPRAARGEIGIIVARGKSRWGIERPNKNVVYLKGMATHFGLKTKQGQLIKRFLGL